MFYIYYFYLFLFVLIHIYTYFVREIIHVHWKVYCIWYMIHNTWYMMIHFSFLYSLFSENDRSKQTKRLREDRWHASFQQLFCPAELFFKAQVGILRFRLQTRSEKQIAYTVRLDIGAGHRPPHEHSPARTPSKNSSKVSPGGGGSDEG